MPDIQDIEFDIFGDPITVSGDITPQDVENGRTLAEGISALLLFLYFYGVFDRQGRRISDAVIRVEVDKLVQAAGGRIERATLQLLNGDISLSIWQARMRNILRAGYSVTGSISRGGLQNMRPQDWATLNRLSAKQIGYLNRFAEQLASGTYDKTAKATVARARSYATSIRSIGNQMTLEALKEAGTEVRRILTAAESCVGCIDWAGRGWMPAEVMRPIGTLDCGSHCRCYFEYRPASNETRTRRDRWNTVEEIYVRL